MPFVYQYVSFISLVLHDVHANTPIFPFDPSTGMAGNHDYHYYPSIFILEQGDELGYCISHYSDNDSRRLCCLKTDSDTVTEFPDILSDAVTQGFAAWGGKLLTPAQALTLAQHLQPSRSFDFNSFVDGEIITQTKTYGSLSLDADDLLQRDVSIT